MKSADLPQDERERLAALDAYDVLDTLPEQAFDDLTKLASYICGTPIALISLIDPSRQWFKSKVGLSATETPRSLAFCAHAILEDKVFVVPDSLEDERFFDNPLAVADDGPRVRYYAGAPLRTPDGHLIGTLCVIDLVPRELSPEQLNMLQALSRQVVSNLELRRTAALAHSATESKSRFLANMSHEIRTPMNGIVGMTNLLLGSVNEPVAVERLSIIKSCANSLLEIINNILDLSKIEFEKIELEKIPFSLKKTTSDVLDLLSSQVSNNVVTLSYNHGTNVPLHVLGDVTRFRQIITNLISNSLKFTDAGRVYVSSSGEKLDGKKWKIQFSVRDTGIGISKLDQAKLFRSFSQANLSTTRKFGGSGLGLAICRGLAKAMGGEIWLESSVGQGSTFSFNFLAEECEPIEPGPNANPFSGIDSEMGKKHPLRILVAEDNRINQLVILGYLARLGYRAKVAVDGNEALKFLGEEQFDLVFMDCHMPELDGFQVTERIGALLLGSRRPRIVALTASTTKDDVDRCYACGMDGFIGKPINIASLVRSLSECKAIAT